MIVTAEHREEHLAQEAWNTVSLTRFECLALLQSLIQLSQNRNNPTMSVFPKIKQCQGKCTLLNLSTGSVLVTNQLRDIAKIITFLDLCCLICKMKGSAPEGKSNSKMLFFYAEACSNHSQMITKMITSFLDVTKMTKQGDCLCLTAISSIDSYVNWLDLKLFHINIVSIAPENYLCPSGFDLTLVPLILDHQFFCYNY